MINRVLLLWILFLPGALFGQITIERTDPATERKTFDPRRPPAEMPKLSPNENAVSQSFFGAETRVGGEVFESVKTADGVRASIKVDMVRMTLRLRLTIWLPSNTRPKLTNHEEGHRRLAERYYENAESIARQLAQELMGQTITGTGPDAQTAADNALKEAANLLGQKYMGQTDIPCGKAQAFYDQITSHGTNAVKEDRAIEDAIAKQKASESRG